MQQGKQQVADDLGEGVSLHRVTSIKTDERGVMQPSDNSEEVRICNQMFHSGALPDTINTVERVYQSVQMLRALGIPPVVGIRQVYFAQNGCPAIWGELPKAVCQGDIASFEEFTFDKDYNPICFANKNLHVMPFGALCRVTRKEDGGSVEVGFTMPQAVHAGLYTPDPGPHDKSRHSAWWKYTKRMLQMRARSQALKDLFPDKLSGIAIVEYDGDEMGGSRRPESVAAAGMAAELSQPEDEVRKPAALERHLAQTGLTDEVQEFAASCMAAQSLTALGDLHGELQKFTGPALTHAKGAYLQAGEKLAQAQARADADAAVSQAAPQT